ncbi:FliM/FliN family flagellar motor switch protein [Novosphingobium taihuense]|uniref:Flagellar motor switch protein FliM n=1 Tax=Novosphingobium taihuense TaxID=260085 RepID=A0A7W7A7E6_9SPHN|nr:FliM/FliN family flagellar motor switch protein [Novosphingobium taihuense]MBB4611829.1 flagellar motor switch protein FliM [Novosphingobium taihuense]TWH88816.1 flagellar motor switch protein FliM [Novosphingobium taihuense]
MKPERAFIAERAIARHDPVLLRPGPSAADLVPALTRMSERLAKAVRGALVPLLGGAEPQINPMKPMQTDFADFCSEIPRLAANSLMQIGTAPFMVSIEGENVLRLVDRAFGGPGDTPSSLPKEFPLSADLMIGRIEQLVAACLAVSLGGAGGPVRSIRRDASLAQLQAMPDATPVASLTLNVVEQGRMPWAIAFAFPLETLSAMFAHGESKRPAKPARGPAQPTDAPFADLPIDVTAVLVDMSLPLATVSALRIGQVLPVPIARSVPVKVGAKTYAHGTIGALDDRVAIQITQLS